MSKCVVAAVWSVLALSSTLWSQGETLLVTTAVDENDVPAGGQLSLREALREATAGDRIVFEEAVFDGGEEDVIVLGGEPLVIGTNLTIDASKLPMRVVVSGDDASRVLLVETGVEVTMRNLTITCGRTADGVDGAILAGDGTRVPESFHSEPGGGILNRGTLTLVDSLIAENRTGRGGEGADGIGSESPFANGGTAGHGGGIYNDGGVLVLERCVVTNNRCGGGGRGGNDVVTTDNDRTTRIGGADGGRGGDGGGIHNAGGTVTVRSSTISKNRAGASGERGLDTSSSGPIIELPAHGSLGPPSAGGGICSVEGEVEIADSRITRNGADWGGGGGGIKVEGGSLTVRRCVLLDNHAHRGGSGGGLHNADGAVTMRDTTIEGNVAGDGFRRPSSAPSFGSPPGGSGGGIYSAISTAGHELVLERVTVSGNRAGASGSGLLGSGSGAAGGTGGGIFHRGGQLRMTQATLSGNRAGPLSASHNDVKGGGLYLAQATASIWHSTITDHRHGGGVVLFGSILSLSKSVLAGNFHTPYSTENSARAVAADLVSEADNVARPPAAPPVDVVLSLGGNLIGSNYRSTELVPGGLPNEDGDLVGSEEAPLDPLLGPLGDHGGHTRTHLPAAGSIAIDAAGTLDPGGTDQRGMPRLSGPALDIGAVEVGAAESFAIPPDGAIGVTRAPVLFWNEPPATGFSDGTGEVFIGTAPDALESLGLSHGGRVEAGLLDPATTYYWRAKMRTEAGWVEGSLHHFTTRGDLLVTTALDEIDGTLGKGAGDSLREVLGVASGDEAADTIRFDPSLDGGMIVLDGEELLVSGDVVVDASDLPGGIAIDANGAVTGQRVMRIRSGAVTLRGLTLRGGWPDGSTHPETDGGGLLVENAAVILQDVRIVDNRTGGEGGGISSAGALEIEDCVLSGNGAGLGGGIRQSLKPLTISRSVLDGNEAETSGGGLHTDVTAAIVGQRLPQVIISECTISNNRATNGAGVSFGGSASVLRSALYGNVASGAGGAVRFGTTSVSETVTLRNSTLHGNVADTGGGIYVSGTLLRLVHTTISGNSANTGGGGLRAGAVSVENTVIAGNVAPNGPEVQLHPLDPLILNPHRSIVTHGANLIGSNQDMESRLPTGAPNENGDFVGDASALIDPQLGPLRNHGGLTHTMLPAPGSPLVEAGEAIPDADATDQRGALRVLGEAPDIGAVEVQRFAILYPGLAAHDDANGNLASNYYEYASGGDPRDPAAGLLGAMATTRSGELRYTHPVRARADDVAVRYFFSTTLEPLDWHPLEAENGFTLIVRGLGQGRSEREVRLSREFTNGWPRLFLRHQFGTPPSP